MLNQSSNFGDQRNVLLKRGFSNKLFTNYILHIIFYIIIIFLLSAFFTSEKSVLESELRSTSQSSSEYESLQHGILWLGIVQGVFTAVFAIVTIDYIIKCFQIKKNYIIITEHGISGEACPSFGFGTLNFNFRFDQIKKVRLGRGRIIFQSITEGKKYHCCIEDRKTVRKIINDKLSN